jgi:hypothetical protein
MITILNKKDSLWHLESILSFFSCGYSYHLYVTVSENFAHHSKFRLLVDPDLDYETGYGSREKILIRNTAQN